MATDNLEPLGELPDDWYIESDGQRLVLCQTKVLAAINEMRARENRLADAIQRQLRDEFAGRALVGLMSAQGRGLAIAAHSSDLAAKAAYRMADAMIAERKRET